MTYKEALEQNESMNGLDFSSLELSDLLSIIDEIPGWDYPLAEEAMDELARRAGIDTDTYFGGYNSPSEFPDDGLPHGMDYNDLYADAVEMLGGDDVEPEEEIVLKISKIDIKSETFCTPWNGKLYCVDICEDAEERSAWLYDSSFGVKSLMWGEEVTNSRDEFLNCVFSNLPSYIEGYEEEFGEG